MGRSTRSGKAVPPGVARLLYTRTEAARALAMSLDTFERHVQPFIKTVMVGQLIQVAPAELDRWIAANSHVVIPNRNEHT